MKEARYYEPRNEVVDCLLCPKHCRITPGATGFCRVRQNIDGKLYSLNYGSCSGYALDPIEKKPLYHFYPGSQIFSIGTWGCNFACTFCQNWEIAQAAPQTIKMQPEAVAAAAAAAGGRNIGIAYTYSEPSVWYEFILDCAALVKENNLQNVIVTNGFINQGPLAELLPLTDAMNIDVKAFNDDFYQKMCQGVRKHVIQSVEAAAQHCHVEITTLVIPGLNDSEAEIRQLARWLSGVNKDMPLHFSRYFPRHKLALPPTPEATLKRAYEIASEYLNYVYIGNVAGMDGTNTHCPNCRLVVIDRLQEECRLSKEKNCLNCGETIAIQGTVAFPCQ